MVPLRKAGKSIVVVGTAHAKALSWGRHVLASVEGLGSQSKVTSVTSGEPLTLSGFDGRSHGIGEVSSAL